MSDDLIQQAREMLKGVTEGPWFVSGVRVTMDRQRWLRVMDEAKEWERAFIPYDDYKIEDHISATANARFIAWCREDVIAILAKVSAGRPGGGER